MLSRPCSEGRAVILHKGAGDGDSSNCLRAALIKVASFLPLSVPWKELYLQYFCPLH